jgi:HopA1 effector protein family
VNRQIINKIVNSDIIVNSVEGWLKGHDYNSLSVECKENVITKLTDIIYQTFYINSNKQTFKQKNIIEKLKKANKSKVAFHKDFVIDILLTNGNLIAKRGDFKIFLKAGQYILVESTEPKLNQDILVCKPIQIYDPENDFFYVYGTALDDNFDDAKLRIYFNLSPDGIPLLIKSVTTLLNEKNIPFTFKCLYETQKFDRCDSSILYFDKRYFNDFQSVWQILYSKIKKHLKPEIPLFTKQIKAGIGLAENPISTKSFGKERCLLIAQGFLNSWSQDMAINKNINSILQYIELKGYDIDNFYLNPKSQFRYDL